MTASAKKTEPGLASELAAYDDLLIPVAAVAEDRTLAYFNSMFASFTKLSPRKLRGKLLTDVLNCPVVQKGETLARCFSDWTPVVSEENTIDAGGGEIRDGIFKFIPHDALDGARYVIVTIQDISIERVLHAKHRIQLDELKAKNAEIKKYSEGLEVLVEERTRELRASMEQSEKLLLNILPHKIAQRLKNNEGTIADRFDEVSVLFADVVSFTTIAGDMDPVRVVEFLSALFNSFDRTLDKYGVEKIKTIGDAYMAVAGAPEAGGAHAEAICRAALDMRDAVLEIGQGLPFPLECRFGISSGPVVAGVLGMKKFAYDIWGDTVNVASRMESHGVAGRIQIAGPTYRLVKDLFVFEERGNIEVKGKGTVQAYFLDGVKPAAR